MDERNLDQKQPWLVEVVLTVQSMYRRNYSAEHTPEEEAFALASSTGKDIRYLDTTLQQLEFLQGADRSAGFERFSAVLADFPNQPGRESKFVDAWVSGDVGASAALISAGLRELPDEQTLLERTQPGLGAADSGYARREADFLCDGRHCAPCGAAGCAGVAPRQGHHGGRARLGRVDHE